MGTSRLKVEIWRLTVLALGIFTLTSLTSGQDHGGGAGAGGQADTGGGHADAGGGHADAGGGHGDAGGGHGDEGGHGDGGHGGGGGHHCPTSNELTIMDLNAWCEVKAAFMFTMVVLVAGFSKIAYHHADYLSTLIPESCILILLGVVFGLIIFNTHTQDEFPHIFSSHQFFIYLLPPIILEAAFSLHDKTFMDNFGSILLYAVVGTIISAAGLGMSLYMLLRAGLMGDGLDIGFIELMVFSSLVVAVDPVAVLAVFNEIGVNHVLYFLVFGESLLNDGVTVVLYKVFQAFYFLPGEVEMSHIMIGITKFFVVCAGGTVTGFVAGLWTAFFTKMSVHVQVAQPIIVYGMAYLGFLIAEIFSFSGIIAIIACGVTQVHYSFHNISPKSRTTIKYFTKVIANTNEIIIFLFLGLALVSNKGKDWHGFFMMWTIFLCTVLRFIIVFVLSFLINTFDSSGIKRIGFQEQFMIGYGGLRGAVAFSLAALLPGGEEGFHNKDLFLTTTLAIIIFTVFVQGITIKPFVSLLQIKLAPEKNATVYKEIINHVTDHLMSGIEDIIEDPDKKDKKKVSDKIENYDSKYMKPWLQIKPESGEKSVLKDYENMLIKDTSKKMKGAKGLIKNTKAPSSGSDEEESDEESGSS